MYSENFRICFDFNMHLAASVVELVVAADEDPNLKPPVSPAVELVEVATGPDPNLNEEEGSATGLSFLVAPGLRASQQGQLSLSASFVTKHSLKIEGSTFSSSSILIYDYVTVT